MGSRNARGPRKVGPPLRAQVLQIGRRAVEQGVRLVVRVGRGVRPLALHRVDGVVETAIEGADDEVHRKPSGRAVDQRPHDRTNGNEKRAVEPCRGDGLVVRA